VPSYRTLRRRLPVFAQDSWRQQLAAASAAHARLDPASLVLYGASTLYFETDAASTAIPVRTNVARLGSHAVGS
jgi:hypothetical protein